MTDSGRVSTLAVVALVVLMAVSGVALAATTTLTSTDEINHDADIAHQTFMDEQNITKATHKMDEWGTSDEDFREYEDDNGDRTTVNYRVNTTFDEPYSFHVTDIEESDFHAFPRDSVAVDDNDTWVDSADWVKGGQNSSELTVENTTTSEGVEAVRFHTSFNGNGGSTVAHANYSSFDIDSDETKRYIQIAAQVDQLTSGATMYVNVTDDDGDYVSVRFDPSADETTYNIVADSTGDTKVLQDQISNLTVQGSGDGTINNLEHVNVTVRGGSSGNDVDVSVAWFDIEKKGETTIAQDEDGDDITEPTSKVYTTGLDTMDSAFDDAVLHDVEAPITWDNDLLDDEDVHVEIENGSDAGYPNWDHVVTEYYRFEVPAQIDFTHAGLELRDEVRVPNGRYLDSTVVEDANDSKDLDEFDFDDGSDPQNTYGGNSEGDEIVLDDSISTDQDYVVIVQYQATDDEVESLKDTGDADDSDDEDDSAVVTNEDGGFWTKPINWFWSAVGVVVGAFGLRKFEIIGGGTGGG